MSTFSFRDHRHYVLPLFQVLAERGGAEPAAIYEEVARRAGITEEEKLIRSARETDNPVYKNRIQFARQALIDARLLLGSEDPRWRRGFWELSDAGKQLAAKKLVPEKLGSVLLERADEGATARHKARRESMKLAGLEEGAVSEEGVEEFPVGEVIQQSENLEVSPERLRSLVEDLNRTTLTSMLEHIRTMNDRSFEFLVGTVLKAALRAESVEVTQKSRDGGFDGILFFDSLGIRIAVFEAKRYADGRKVGRQQVDAFSTAARRRRADHKLFVASSSFSPEAISAAREEGIRLIDGEAFVELMAQHGVGLRVREQFSLYALDPAWSVESDE